MSRRRGGAQARQGVFGTRAATARFDAFAFGTPIAWYSAESIISPGEVPAPGSTVSTWYDLSGNGRNLTKNTGTATYTGNKYVTCVSANFFSPTFTRPDDYTIYIQPTSSTVSVGLVSADGTPPTERWWSLRLASTRLEVVCYTGVGATVSQGTLTAATLAGLTTSPVVTMHRSAALGTIVRRDGAVVASDATYTPGSGVGSVRNIWVGSTSDTAGTFTGDLKQIVMYPTGHDASTMMDVETAITYAAAAGG